MKWNYYAISSSYAATASYALNASSTNTGSLLLNASALQNVITFTRGNGSVFNVTVATGSSISSAFPYTGSAQITGSLGITGSFSQQGSPNVFLKGLINQVNPASHVVMLDNTTGQLYITASSALGGGGGGGGTPGGLTGQIQYNNAGAFGGVSVLIYNGTTLSATGSFSGSFTGILIGTASYAYTSSYALNAVSASFSSTASYVLTAQTASYYKVFPYTGSAIISGSLTVTGSTILKGDFSVNNAATIDLNTSVLNINAPLITVPTFATPYSPSVNIRTVMYDAVSNALFVTSSLPGTGGGGTGLSNFISTGSITASVNTDINNLFLVKSGSVDLLKINSEKVLITFTQSATPIPIIGGIFISSSGDLFFGI